MRAALLSLDPLAEPPGSSSNIKTRTVPVTALRAAIIIGSGSASFEIIKNPLDDIDTRSSIEAAHIKPAYNLLTRYN
jgi:hypothetical protein